MTDLRRVVRSTAVADGPHRMEERLWALVGPAGATQFLTHWHPPTSPIAAHAVDDAGSLLGSLYLLHADGSVSMPVDVGCHAVPLHDDDQHVQECDVLPGGACRFDGSSLAALRLAAIWSKGDYDEELIWAALYSRYTAEFEGGDTSAAELLMELLGRPAPEEGP